MVNNKKTLYEQVVTVSEEFLGPAGERFIDRQIKTHLNISPAQLSAGHLEDLVHWASLTFAVLTNNSDEVDDFANKLAQLSVKNGKSV